MVDLIEQVILVIGYIWSRFIVANCYTMVMGLSPFSAQSNVVDARIVSTEVFRKMQRQMMHRRKVNDSEEEIFNQRINDVLNFKLLKLTLLSTQGHRLGLGAIRIPDQDDHRLHRMSFLVDFYS